MSRPDTLGTLARPVTALVSALRAAGIALLRRRTLGTLGGMDDRMLRDIGLTRQDVWSAAAEPLFHDPTLGLATRAEARRVARRAAQREARAALARLWAEDSRAA